MLNLRLSILLALFNLGVFGAQFDHIGPENPVFEVLVTADGTVWCGTDHGLTRYNGHELVQYPVVDGLSREVQEIKQDEMGRLWLGTKHGLSIFDPKSSSHKTYLPGGSQLAHGRVRSIHLTGQQMGYIGTYGGGVQLVNYDADSILSWQLVPGTENWAVGGHFAHSGRLYLAAEGQRISWIDLETGQLEQSQHPSSYLITSWLEHDGQLLFASADTIYQYQSSTDQVQVWHTNVDMRGIRDMVSAQDTLWVAHLNGLHCLSALETVHFYPKEHSNRHLRSRQNWALEKGKNGVLWIGANDNGLCKWDPQSNIFRPVSHQVIGTGLGRIWGTNNKNQLATSRDGITWSPAEGLNADQDIFYAVQQVGPSEIWLATREGMYMGKGQRFEFHTTGEMLNKSNGLSGPYHIRPVAEDQVFWAGWNTGIVASTSNGRWNHVSYDQSNTELPSDIVWNFLPDSAGQVLVATDQELGMLNLSNGQWKSVAGSGGIFALAPANGYWLYGTIDGALIKLTPDLATDTLLILNARINDIHRHHQQWWIATTDGLYQWDGKHSPRHFHRRHGMSNTHLSTNNSWNIGDTLLWSTRNGSYWHHKSWMQPTVVPGRVIMESVVCGDQAFNNNALYLPPDFSNLSITASSSEIRHPATTVFAYRISEIDTTWSKFSGPQLNWSITSLPPGRYTLEVHAGGPVHRIKLEVGSPWYARPPALFLYLGLIGLLVWLVRKTAIRQTELKNARELKALKQKQKEELQQTKLQFFTSLSHELRTPLTLILGPLERLKAKLSGDQLAEVNRVTQNAEYLNQLVDELLDFRRLEHGLEQLQMEQVDMAEVCRSSVSHYTSMAEIRQIGITLAISGDCMVLGHPASLRKVMHNLLSNAVKFSPPASTIQVWVKQEDDQVMVTVLDQGPGVQPEDAERIFERFYSTPSDQAVQSSSGIGLHFSSQIVARHNGAIRAIPNASGGVFELTLPHFADLEPIGIEAMDDASGPRILIVEDNPGIRDFLSEELQSVYQVITARNGQEALDVLENESVHIILSDVMMPVMDGISLCKAIKQSKALCHIPVVLLTARTAEEFKISGLEAQADAYLHKPFSIKELKLTLSNLIRAREAWMIKWSTEGASALDDLHLVDHDKELLKKVDAYIDSHLGESSLTVEQLGKHVGLHRSHLHRKLVDLLGLSAKDLIIERRMNKAGRLLHETQLNVSEIAYEVGYSDPKYFSKQFKATVGMSPKQYRDQGP